ncbi:hypothetical protein [Leucothrix mucor]|uniref:hypothetical protein n=1 Tax=Leucothrix mucor TaxID=45248 RepID=UPI0003B69E44|nr:hypothetical protein [Leucothrix mucor]
MAKKIKFNLRLDGNPVRNIEGIRDNFSIDDVLEVYQDGILQRWLKSRGFDDICHEVKNIEDKDNPIFDLLKIFEVPFDEEEVSETMISIQRLNRRRERMQLLDKLEKENGIKKILFILNKITKK